MMSSNYIICPQLGETRASSYGPATYQDFKEIRSRCLADGTLFEDPEFPPIDRSLYYKERLDRPINWLRPHVSVSFFCFPMRIHAISNERPHKFFFLVISSPF